jgi:hypothetical protein
MVEKKKEKHGTGKERNIAASQHGTWKERTLQLHKGRHDKGESQTRCGKA